MRSRALLAFTVWLFALAGCGPRQTVGQCSPSGVLNLRPPVAVVFARQSSTVDLVLPPAVFCENGNPIATEVVTEVVSASNERLPHTATPAATSQSRGYSTSVTFTADAPGVYELSARFEPGLGVARRQVQVVADRSDAVPTLRVATSALCDEARGLGAHVLCRRGATLSVWREGDAGVLLSEPVSGFGTAGDTAWWWTTTQVTRAVEVDGGLERLDLAVSLGAGAVQVQRDAVTRIDGTGALEVKVQDGGLTSASWSLLAGHDGGGLARRGDLLGFWNGTEVCAHTLAVEDASVACLDVQGFTPLGAENEVLWLRGVETGLMARARLISPGTPMEVRLLDGQPSVFSEAKQVLPTFTWSGRVVTLRADSFTFEAWQAPSQTQRQFVTPEHVVFQRANELLVFTR